MHRRTLAAVVLSLCSAGAVAPTIATAAAAPAVAPATALTDVTDGTSNTIMLADSSLHLEPGSNELVVTSVSGDDIARLRAALATGGRLDAVTLVTRRQTAALEGVSLSRLTHAGTSSAVSLNYLKITYNTWAWRRNTDTSELVPLIVATSGRPSPLKSAALSDSGSSPTVYGDPSITNAARRSRLPPAAGPRQARLRSSSPSPDRSSRCRRETPTANRAKA